MGDTSAIVNHRWQVTLNDPASLADDLAFIGTWVGPRSGPDKRTHGQKEDYVLRRILAACKLAKRIEFPTGVCATTDEPRQPDFVLSFPIGETLGIEVTEAGDEDYQKWLTYTEDREHSEDVVEMPFSASTDNVASQIKDAIQRKVSKWDKGFYRSPDTCDLVVYDNTAWGGFLDKDAIVRAIGRPNNLLGRFRQVHLVTERFVFLDFLGPSLEKIDVERLYEVDYANWIRDQIELLQRRDAGKLDFDNIAEELKDLGKSERRALGSHVRNLILHLLKWQYQPKKRGDSWSPSIDNARSEMHERLTEAPSLRNALAQVVRTEYRRARRDAARQTKFDLDLFPEQCPYTLIQLVDPEYRPDGSGK